MFSSDQSRITSPGHRRQQDTARFATSLVLCLVPFLESIAPAAVAAEDAKALSILAVGNSFTRNATNYLPAIVEASRDNKLVLDTAAIGGGPLARHWQGVEAYEADSTDPKGRIYGNKSLHDKLTARRWDYVTIQQNSYLSTDPATYRPYAAKLAAYIRKHAPTAEVVMHQTWAYRADDRRFTPNSRTQEEMYRKLTEAYQTIAGEISVKKTIPVGLAFRTARQEKERVFTFPDPDFDYKNAVYPALPNQDYSLNIGWRWSKGKLRLDTHHANARGQYLAASVWFGFFFETDVRKNSYAPPELDEQDAAFLRKIAHRVTIGDVERDVAASELLRVRLHDPRSGSRQDFRHAGRE